MVSAITIWDWPQMLNIITTLIFHQTLHLTLLVLSGWQAWRKGLVTGHFIAYLSLKFISSWLSFFREVFLLWPKISHNDSYGFLMAFQFCIVNYPYYWYTEVCYLVLCVLNSHFIAHLILSFRIKPAITVKVDFYRQEKITKILLIEQLQNFMVKVFL
jgi:hypothetical protein